MSTWRILGLSKYVHECFGTDEHIYMNLLILERISMCFDESICVDLKQKKKKSLKNIHYEVV